jgi:hypothetical protein
MSNLSHQSYDPTENILFVTHPSPVRLETREQIVTYFDDIVRFFRERCRGKKAYYLVDWTRFETNVRENDVYAANVKRVVSECAITIVRFTDSPIQRTAGRLVAVKLHVPSHVYDTREEAIAVVRSLRAAASER